MIHLHEYFMGFIAVLSVIIILYFGIKKTTNLYQVIGILISMNIFLVGVYRLHTEMQAGNKEALPIVFLLFGIIMGLYIWYMIWHKDRKLNYVVLLFLSIGGTILLREGWIILQYITSNVYAKSFIVIFRNMCDFVRIYPEETVATGLVVFFSYIIRRFITELTQRKKNSLMTPNYDTKLDNSKVNK